MAIGFAVLVGIIKGVLVAYFENPAIFATLAMGVTVYGFGKYFLVQSDVDHLPEGWRWLADMVAARPLGVPVPAIAFLGCAAVAQFQPVASYHSRRGGRFHGVTSALQVGDRVLVTSRGGPAILALTKVQP